MSRVKFTYIDTKALSNFLYNRIDTKFKHPILHYHIDLLIAKHNFQELIAKTRFKFIISRLEAE